jgi:hypothetical protein
MLQGSWFPAHISMDLVTLFLLCQGYLGYVHMVNSLGVVGEKVSQLLLELQVVYDPYLLKRW